MAHSSGSRGGRDQDWRSHGNEQRGLQDRPRAGTAFFEPPNEVHNVINEGAWSPTFTRRSCRQPAPASDPRGEPGPSLRRSQERSRSLTHAAGCGGLATCAFEMQGQAPQPPITPTPQLYLPHLRRLARNRFQTPPCRRATSEPA